MTVRVLHVVAGLRVGGIETYLLNVLRHYDRSHFQMDVCCKGDQTGPLEGQALASGSRVIPCHYTNRLLPYATRLARILVSGRYDCVCDFTGDFAAASLMAARMAGLRSRIAFYRSSKVLYRPTLGRRLVGRYLRYSVKRNATAILGNSRTNLRAAFPSVSLDGDRFAVVYNGVDLKKFSPLAKSVSRRTRSELGIPLEARVVGHVGSFYPVKNHEAVITALASLATDLPDVVLLFVGDGPLRSPTADLAARLGLSSRVVFAGLRQDVPNMLAAMDLFVFPSRFEGMPNALLEAQAAGLPVVASDRAEIREAMPSGNHDCLATLDDTSSLGAQMMKLLTDRQLAQRKAIVGREFVVDNFSIAGSTKDFCRHLARGFDGPVHLGQRGTQRV